MSLRHVTHDVQSCHTYDMTDSTEDAKLPKSTKSRNLNPTVQIQIRTTQIPRYLALQIQIEILVGRTAAEGL